MLNINNQSAEFFEKSNRFFPILGVLTILFSLAASSGRLYSQQDSLHFIMSYGLTAVSTSSCR